MSLKTSAIIPVPVTVVAIRPSISLLDICRSVQPNFVTQELGNIEIVSEQEDCTLFNVIFVRIPDSKFTDLFVYISKQGTVVISNKNSDVCMQVLDILRKKFNGRLTNTKI